jgi:subtilisin family serine protease
MQFASRAGNQTTEGVSASNANAWHTAGYDGTGTRVAVIDGGFSGYSGLLGTDLPDTVTTYDWTGTGMEGSAHGTACAEVVFDMAPGIMMDLHKVSTTEEIANAVSQAITDGIDIVSMSLGWHLDGPGDGTGPLADLVNNARTSGIFFTKSAGNNAEASWSGTFTDTTGDDFHEWVPGAQNINYFGPGDGKHICHPSRCANCSIFALE